jgi:hypothetical protein
MKLLSQKKSSLRKTKKEIKIKGNQSTRRSCLKIFYKNVGDKKSTSNTASPEELEHAISRARILMYDF